MTTKKAKKKTATKKASSTDRANKLKHWRIERADNGIAWVHCDRKEASANTLSHEVLKEFEVCLDELARSNPKGAIIKSDKAGFILGADIKEFTEFKNEMEALVHVQYAHALFNRLAAFVFPTVAMINGHALGGGYELALACRYRVAADDNNYRIGLPEVMLGIHPGFGGTVRLIQLIGVLSAMDLILTGRGMIPKLAAKLGMVDKVVPMRHLESVAEQMVLKPTQRKSLAWWLPLANHKYARPIVANMMRKKVAKKAAPEHYPAPYAVIDLWAKYGDQPTKMLEQEAFSIAHLFSTDTAKNLVRVFFLQEGLKALGKKARSKTQAPTRRVHVIGAGVMGGDIAAWCALRGLYVTLQDQNPDALSRVLKRARTLYQRQIRDQREVQAVMDRLIPDLKGQGVGRADVIIEAIFEDVKAKSDLLSSIEPQLKTSALLATNTSSIPLEVLGKALKKPSRLVGLHFFNPVAKMQLIEIVSGKRTTKTEVQRAAQFAHQINRLPVPVSSSPGFLVNRVLMPYLMESVLLLSEGVAGAQIDKAAVDFGMPMGPVELADTVGLDICLSVAENLSESLGGEVPDSLRDKVNAKQLGKKSGEGFYVWKGGRPNKPTSTKSDQTDISDRLIFRFLNETVACIREGVVTKGDHLDAGMIFGTGFAPFRGGPLHYIKHQGAAKMHQRLKNLQKKYGDRFKPDTGWQKLDALIDPSN